MMTRVPQKWTPKNRKFVEEYLVDQDRAAAVRRAGYAAATSAEASSIARALMAAPFITQEIEERLAARRKATDEAVQATTRSAIEIIQDVQHVTREAMRSEAWNASLKALELEAKLSGLFVEAKPQPQEINLNLIHESRVELEERVAKLLEESA